MDNNNMLTNAFNDALNSGRMHRISIAYDYNGETIMIDDDGHALVFAHDGYHSVAKQYSPGKTASIINHPDTEHTLVSEEDYTTHFINWWKRKYNA